MGKTLGQIAFEAFDPDEDDEQIWSEIRYKGRRCWESAAAAVAAEVRRETGWRPIAEAPDTGHCLVGYWWRKSEWLTDKWTKAEAVYCGFTHYLPEPDPPPQEANR